MRSAHSRGIWMGPASQIGCEWKRRYQYSELHVRNFLFARSRAHVVSCLLSRLTTHLLIAAQKPETIPMVVLVSPRLGTERKGGISNCDGPGVSKSQSSPGGWAKKIGGRVGRTVALTECQRSASPAVTIRNHVS